MAALLERARAEVRAVGSFRLHPRERRFALTILEHHTNWWVFRTDQRRRAGDFCLVDMSAPDPEHRALWVVELKLGRPLRIGGGGAGNQLGNAALAQQALACSGVLGPTVSPRLAAGGAEAVLAALASGGVR